MKTSIRLFLVILIFPLFMSVTFPVSVGAVDVIKPVCDHAQGQSDIPAVCKDNKANANENPLVGPNGVLTKAIQILAAVVGIAAVFTMVISGVRMITSGGDGGKVASARNGFIFALIGIVVAVVAEAIVALVLKRIGSA